MNFCSVPYEADFGGVDANKGMMPMGMQNGPMGNAGGMAPMPMGPQMNLNTQMQMPPMTTAAPMSFPLHQGINGGGMPMQSLPMGMMPQGAASMPMSTQLPYGSVTPLSSMTMMPMAGAIDAPGMNAVIPDLQSMSAGGMAPQMGQMNQYNQMHQGRLMGGSVANTPASWNSCNNQPSNQMWGNFPQSGNFGNNMHYQHQMQQQQSQSPSPQQMQQHQRMKNQYDSMNYNRDMRNGLNSPMQDSMKFSKAAGNQYNCSKNGKMATHWR
ncbi:protein pygopus [Drosophila tropicalis]|uniref:protein pygopus n=1 Tax=Drosophila tropicalis TaxID=46794 RepID=UPI0035ABFDDB